MHEYDRGSKWLIQHHGDAILRLAGIRDLVSWRALQAEVVQPRQLPDGLLEVRLAGRSDPDLFVLELATYPELRLREQIARDVMLVYLDRRVVPEVVALVLHPKGRFRAGTKLALHSRLGRTRLAVGWRVVELWTVPAEDLLAADDVGLILWVPLSQFTGPPEPLLQQCRERIDRQAAPDERANLLAVVQVMAGLRYNDPRLLSILGGSRAMIESPVLQRLTAEREAETQRKDILKILRVRFGPLTQDVTASLQTIEGKSKLDELVEVAASCPDLEAFRARLQV
jgi:predicted transposase YdaD